MTQPEIFEPLTVPQMDLWEKSGGRLEPPSGTFVSSVHSHTPVTELFVAGKGLPG
jgi:hypothetical protein